MKKVISLILFSSLLVGCSGASTADKEPNHSEALSNKNSEVSEVGFEFTFGVDASNISYADEENYVNIEGISHDGKKIYVIYDGTVVDTIIIDNDGFFEYHSKANEEVTRLVFSDDSNLIIGDNNLKTSDLENSKAINVYPNENSLTTNFEESSKETESEIVEESESSTVEKEEFKIESKSTEEYVEPTDVSIGGKYQAVLDDYTQKIKEAAPKLVQEYNSEYPNNQNGLEGLAELSNEKISELAEISNDGIGEMAEIYFNNGSGDYEVYEDWASKLTDVYMDEAGAITDAYMTSAQ